MKLTNTILAALAAAVLATGALAEEMVRSQDPASVTAFLFEEGIPSKTDVDNYGDPMVMFRKGDQPYTIWFYDCVENAECASIRFYSGYETDGAVGLDFANMLNLENRFATALIDAEDDLVLIMDVLTGANGMPYSDFRNLLEVFVSLIEDAEMQMDN